MSEWRSNTIVRLSAQLAQCAAPRKRVADLKPSLPDDSGREAATVAEGDTESGSTWRSWQRKRLRVLWGRPQPEVSPCCGAVRQQPKQIVGPARQESSPRGCCVPVSSARGHETEHCTKIDVQKEDSPEYLARWIHRKDDSSQCEDTRQQEMEESRVRGQDCTISIHVKDPQQGSQVSRERQQNEQFIFKAVAHAAHTKMTDIQ